MAAELKKQLAEYRLLHFQPDPEDGDRVCVGILLHEDGRFTVLSDDRFPKLHCLAPGFEPDLVGFYLTDLERSLNRSHDPVEITLRRYAPQLVVSEARSVVMPISESTKLRLLERFVIPGKPLQGEPLASSRIEMNTAEHIRHFLNEFAPLEGEIISNARPQALFGKHLPNAKAVAFAIRRNSNFVLVDGVDLNTMTPAKAISKTNQVVHTFWQYGRFRSEDLIAGQATIQRVGIVLNGRSPQTERYMDAHDYALHQFRHEADVTVDSTSGEGREQLKAILQ
jgi:hypothetical protein